MANLVIVESPSKANTIKSYLGSSYKVIASVGHIRDLPKSTLGIDVENGFAPHYINIRGKGDVIKELKKEAKLASKIYLATDPDREGEAISWHIAEELGISKDTPCRVTFNEITKSAVKEGIKHPRKINEDLVNSQQARRILDRLVGFKLSEVLWKKLKSGLSAGRVQSVATRIITEREEEIRAFVPQEYWTIEASFNTASGDTVSARFYGDSTGKLKIENEAQADKILSAVNSDTFKVSSVKHTQKYKAPMPPFTTSSLIQDASKKLGFQSQKIMKVAQELYDGLNIGAELGGFQGLITYMRTDSTRISDSAKNAAAAYIAEAYGKEYIPKNERVYKSATGAQDAHEAIRPSNPALAPSKVRKALSSDQYKLYKLIWERFIASQMESAVLDTVSVDIESGGYVFKTGGYIIKFRGYLAVYDGGEKGVVPEDEEEENLAKLPDIKRLEKLKVTDIKKNQHFTEPPPRYTEASLVDFFKERGIGRPSTYAPTITIITSRNYVKRDGKSLVATPLGELITNYMRANFPEIIDYDFTATMEATLDSIENKETTIIGVLSDFYKKFEKDLADALKAERTSGMSLPHEVSEVPCDFCGKLMVYKTGRFGKFLACPSYPQCKCTKAVDSSGKVIETAPAKKSLAGFKCEACGAEMLVRRGRYGEFYACSNYPSCKFTKQKVMDTGVPCPICSSKILSRHAKGNSLFYSCEAYPECSFSSWDKPLLEKCPDCGANLYYKKSKKAVICKEKSCSYQREEEMPVDEL
ncbi:MAG: type I DNA topoisomerase [Clostridia bacterium]|nr:type I DNA topoisomerase [Clostridia bacterium]